MDEYENYIAHYGILRRSGRYPWGSGKDANQRNRGFLDAVSELHKQGMSEVEIAKSFGISTSELRAAKSIAKTEVRKADQAFALRLKDKGMSNVAIGARMGINESSVRALLNPAIAERTKILGTATSFLRDQVDEHGYIDVGAGVEHHLGISEGMKRNAIAQLKEEGYKVHYVKVQQLGTGHETTIKVLARPESTYSEVIKNKEKIQIPDGHSEDRGRTILTGDSYSPVSVNSKRLDVRYAEDGGGDADGVIYLRPGIADLSLGGKQYAQVRIAVDGTHYLKGMAMYKDDLPAGVDLQFNTNKSRKENKLDALKPLGTDESLPFGAVVRPHYYEVNGKPTKSPLNIVNEEGTWDTWSRSLSSQMLSKQAPSLARQQLDLAYGRRQAEFEEIMALTNPTVKKKLLLAFADGSDSAAVHLKAAALPRQSTRVILPINSLKDNEVYAPTFTNGEPVVLIRYPHGGIFEIPELRVNNRNPEGKKLLGQAPDAIGINANVAKRLSGADFDGDTVLVIPNGQGRVRGASHLAAAKGSSALASLKNFDPQTEYPGYPGMPVMTEESKQMHMGRVSNLITDMTIRGAPPGDIARAVKHSMVVIDAAKHGLNYKQSAIDQGIAQLKEEYQGGSRYGASTLISRSSAEARVPERIPRRARDGGPIDPATGKKVYTETGASYTNAKGKTVQRTTQSTKGAEAEDAFSLSSGTLMESVYATHANRLKTLANNARKEALSQPKLERIPSAREAYKNEVDQLAAKLRLAQRNAPLERHAQLVAGYVVASKRQANPDMETAAVKKLQGVELNNARNRIGAKKSLLSITPREWEAIQAGAISESMLGAILDAADLDVIKQYATPRTPTVMTAPTLARAKAMLNAGYTQAEISEALGVAVSTLNSSLVRES